MMTDTNYTGQNRLDGPALSAMAIAPEIERLAVDLKTKITRLNTNRSEKATRAKINATLVSRVSDGERCNPHSQQRIGNG